jgi:hypothetical protein
MLKNGKYIKEMESPPYPKPRANGVVYWKIHYEKKGDL